MSASAEPHSGNLFDIVYGSSPPAYDDPAECFFEASKLHTQVLNCDLPGALALQKSAELQLFTRRGARPNHSRELSPLPEPAPLRMMLAEVLTTRCSAHGFGSGELPMDVLAGLLVHSYGTTDLAGLRRRPTPSGGALYPIDLFVVAERVQGLAKGMYHYDPYRNGLTQTRKVDFEALCQATFHPELARECAAMIVLGATFWRSRFKYGQRGLRFCLMDAGHLMQSLLLLGVGYSLAVRPIGGFLDDEVASAMDFDGVDEAPLYLMLVGIKDSE
jgi:SagB-type dehydrogenase family enzyme